LASTAAACGSLDSNTDTPPVLATVQGSLVNPNSLPIAGSTRVAVVWRTSVPGQFRVAQDLPVQAVFPAAFTIQLDGPPPPEAMNVEGADMPPPSTGAEAGSSLVEIEADGGVTMQSLRSLSAGSQPLEYAIGTVVAYVDSNGNGKLDLIEEDAGSYVDQVLATNVDTSIAYFQGALPAVIARAKNAPVLGYNLLSQDACNDPPQQQPAQSLLASFGWPPNPACTTSVPDAGVAADAGTCPPPTWLPIATPFVLTVATAPQISSVACLNGGPDMQPSAASGTGTMPFGPDVQPAQYPDPCDKNLECASDGSQYTYFTCNSTYEGLCLPPSVSCTTVSYTRPTPAPAAWPCIH
jgi:hypothetical protein